MKYTAVDEKALKGLNAGMIRGWYDWLKKNGDGCCSLAYAQDGDMVYYVCMGWIDCGGEGDGYKIAWKIGRQTVRNAMQCDFPIDFEMPYDAETGEVDDTLNVFEDEPWAWGAIAADMRNEARRVAHDWIVPEVEDAEDLAA